MSRESSSRENGGTRAFVHLQFSMLKKRALVNAAMLYLCVMRSKELIALAGVS